MDNNKVLRASRIGSLCDRALFYSVNGAEEITSEKLQRIFEVGRILKPVIVRWLCSDGWKVQRNLFVNSNEGMCLSIKVDGGTIEAHPDCVISRDDSGLILADIKTMNDRGFRNLKREGTAKSHPQYADQLTIYALSVSSETRKYIPIGFMSPEVIASDACSIIPDVWIYEFAVLTSSVHMARVRVVAGRIKSDIHYSPAVYNNFVRPSTT